MKKIMVVAGGDWQVCLVKKAKEMGHYVICSNLYEDSPAFPYADACEVADVLDKEKNLKIAERYMPDAVITDQSDIAVPTVAYVNERLGLRGIGTDLASLFTNKYEMRLFCRDRGIPVPDFKLCRTPEEAAEFLKGRDEMIIKPIDSQAGRGVFLVRSEEDIRQHFEKSMSFSNREKVVLAEQYIRGEEFSVDGLCVEGVQHPLAISRKEHYAYNPNMAKTLFFSHADPEYDYELLRRQNKTLVEAAGLPFGLTHAEYKFQDGRYYLIEIGARGGGSNISGKVTPYMSGIDHYACLIRQALGQPVQVDVEQCLRENSDRYAVLSFFEFGEGTVARVEGRELLESLPNIIDFQLNVKPGEVLKNPEFSRQRPGHYIGVGTSRSEVEALMERIDKSVRVFLE